MRRAANDVEKRSYFAVDVENLGLFVPVCRQDYHLNIEDLEFELESEILVIF
jgi:hypothetical protein